MELHGEFHNRVDNIVIVVLERLDGLSSGNIGLRHDKLNVLSLHSSLVDLGRVEIRKRYDNCREKWRYLSP